MSDNGSAQVQGTDEAVYADLTPYAAMKTVNVMLARAGVDDVKVTSQAMYSRAAKGVVKAYERNEPGVAKWWIDGADFARWAKRYVSGYVNGTATTTKVDAEALADMYSV